MVNYKNIDDQNLLFLMRNEDVRAFEELYERYFSVLAAQVYKVIQSKEEVQDILQELFLSIWNRRSVIEVKGPLLAYLLGSVRKLSIKHLEKNIHQSDFLKSLIKFADNLPESPYEKLEAKNLEEIITAAVKRLPQKMKNIFELSRNENLSYREIALLLGISENTVKKQIHNALDKIRLDIGNDKLVAVVMWYLILHSIY